MTDPLDEGPEALLRELLGSPHWKALVAKLEEKCDALKADMVAATYTHHEDMLQANRTQAVIEWLTDFLGNPEAFLLPEPQKERPQRPPISPRAPVGRLLT